VPLYELTHTERDPSRNRLFRFEGELLGEASSYMHGKDRWSEMRLYRTSLDEYVVEKMGNSSRPGDSIRSTIHHATTPQGAIESMQTSDDDGVVYFTRLARTVLDQACREDPDLRYAYQVRDLT